MRDKKAFIIYLLISIVLWQLIVSVSKILVNFSRYENFDYGLFSIVETTNKGAAFGVLQNSTVLLSILGICVISFIVYYVFRFVSFNDKMKILLCSVFTSGIIGNTYERIANGEVFDFIKLNFINFPVFNLFDILICISVILYIFYFIKEEKNEV